MKFEVKLQNLILTSVIGAIVLTVGGLTWLVYHRLYDAILEGFDSKLSAISTVTAAFVDAPTHERLLAPRQIRALAYDEDTKTLFGVDNSFDRKTLVRIETSGDYPGAAEAVATLERKVESLAWSGRANTAFGLTLDYGAAPTLVELNLVDGSVRELRELPTNTQAISFDADNGVLFAGGSGLYRATEGSFEPKMIPGTEALAITELCLLEDGNLLGFDFFSLRFFIVDPETGIEQGAQSLLNEKDKAAFRKHPPVGFTRIPGERSLLVATDRLRFLDPTSFTWTAPEGTGETIAGFRSEISPLYRSFGEPMRRIHRRKDLTFLYTQTLSDSETVIYEGQKRSLLDLQDTDRIIYVLNVSPESAPNSGETNADDADSLHTEIGYHDEENAASEPIRDVFFKGDTYLSPIKSWKKWGLLKAGFAPILDQDGQVVAMVGADIAVDKIHAKTKIALLTVTLTGLGAILIASLVSFRVARRLTEPIEELKEIALRIAAGQFGEEVEKPKLAELSQLADSFNTMSQTLRNTVSGLEETNRDWEEDQEIQELIRHLTLRGADLENHRAWVEMIDGTDPHLRPSGWTNRGSLVWGWLVEVPGDRDDRIEFRVGLATFLYQVSREGRPSDEEIDRLLTEFLGKDLSLNLFSLDLESLEGRFHRKQNPVLWTWSEEAGCSSWHPIEGDTFQLSPGLLHVIGANPGVADDLDQWMRCRAAKDPIDSLKIQMTAYRETAGEEEDPEPGGIAIRIRTEGRSES